MDEEWNPNGSYRAIEGITSPDGRVLGKMAHSEPVSYTHLDVYKRQVMNGLQKLFEEKEQVDEEVL